MSQYTAEDIEVLTGLEPVRKRPGMYTDTARPNHLDQEVIDFLQESGEAEEMLKYIRSFLHYWIPRFEQQNRCYLTISIGCTGGQHRSVYITEQLCDDFSNKIDHVSLRHRELD